MPLTFLMALLLVAVIEAASSRVEPCMNFFAAMTSACMDASSDNPDLRGIAFMIAAIRAVLLAPLAIAVHRFVLLGERLRVLPFLPIRRTAIFSGWVFAIPVMFSIGDLVGGNKIVAGVLGFAGFVVSVQLGLLFPATAVVAPGGTLARSWRQTRWRFWRMFSVEFLAEAPFLFVVILLMQFGPSLVPIRPVAGPVTHEIVSALLSGAASVLLTAVGAAALSWLYRGLSEAVRVDPV